MFALDPFRPLGRTSNTWTSDRQILEEILTQNKTIIQNIESVTKQIDSYNQKFDSLFHGKMNDYSNISQTLEKSARVLQLMELIQADLDIIVAVYAYVSSALTYMDLYLTTKGY